MLVLIRISTAPTDPQVTTLRQALDASRRLSAKLAGLLLIGIPLILAPIILLGRQVRAISTRSQDRIADVSTVTGEVLGAMKIVQAFGQQGREASRFAEEVLLGRRVTLEFDGSQGRHDQYGRTLAYVWTAAPHPRLFNLMAVRRGYALEYTFDRAYSHRDDFVQAEGAAREAGVGVWTCPVPGQ